MLNRRITRTVFGGVETTQKTSSINSDTLTLDLTTATYLYVGYHGKFAARYFQVSTPNTVTSNMSCEYWNGSAWTAVTDFQDQTSSGGKTLATSGFMSWENQSDWVKTTITGIDSDVEMFWVRFTCSANLTGTTALQSVINLFSDDLLLRAYYPELVSDSRYLPASRTDFLEQHESAKNLCIQRLKQRRVIDDESQVVDLNAVAVAAVHAVAWLILNPIATSDQVKALAEAALTQFNTEIGSLSLNTDQDKSGIVSDYERAEAFRSVGVIRR